ncbi:serotransferrin-like [Callithrix jacchus]
MRLALCALPCAGALEDLANKADRDEYELLCLDNTQKLVDEYHLAWVASHTVVAQSVGGKEDLISELLNQVQWQVGIGRRGAREV